MLRRQLLACGAAALFAAACERNPSEPSSAGPDFTIVDGRHNAGNPRFFFLPPMVPDPGVTGSFDGTQHPEVDICELAGSSCAGAPIAHFSTTTGTNNELVVVSAVDEHYAVKWRTRDFTLDLSKIYRITVMSQGYRLGYADVQLVASGKDLKNVNTGEYIPLIDGHLLNIKFRIDMGIFPLLLTALSGDGQEAAPGVTLSDPLVVRVTDASGFGAEGVVVGFGVQSGGGMVTPGAVATSPSGHAQASWALGTSGSQAVLASVAGASGSPVTFTATFTSAAAALLLDGANDYVEIASSAAFNVDELTIEAWVRLDQNVAATQARIANRQISLGGGESWGLEIFGAGYEGSSGNEVMFHSGNCLNHFNLRTGFNLQVGRWYHLAAVNDGITGRVYVDGVQVGTVASRGLPCKPVTPIPIVIGKSGIGSDLWFPGAIDDFRLWGVVRSAADISLNMRARLTGTEAGLAGYWRFDEGSGLTASDATGQGNTGILFNGATWTAQSW